MGALEKLYQGASGGKEGRMYPLRPVLFRIGDWWGNERFGMIAKILSGVVFLVFAIFFFGWAFCKSVV